MNRRSDLLRPYLRTPIWQRWRRAKNRSGSCNTTMLSGGNWPR